VFRVLKRQSVAILIECLRWEFPWILVQCDVGPNINLPNAEMIGRALVICVESVLFSLIVLLGLDGVNS
jgi:hypothetical protein